MYVQYTTALAFSALAPMMPTIVNAANAIETDSFILEVLQAVSR